MVLAWMTAPTGKTNGQAGRQTAIRRQDRQPVSQSIRQINTHTYKKHIKPHKINIKHIKQKKDHPKKSNKKQKITYNSQEKGKRQKEKGKK